MRKAFLLIAALWLAGATAQHDAAAQPWRSLLDDAGSAWRGWKSDAFPAGWRISGDEISKDGEVEDLVSREMFGDFELAFEWRIGEGGNSGIFYRGTREYDYIFWSAPEYQLLDDANAPDGRDRLSSAAAAYALYAAPAGIVKPHGEWNTSRIVVDGARVEHWLNGRKVVDYELWSPDWKARVAASKFGKFPDYGLAAQGYLGIQGDHPGTLALRHIRIRALRQP
jgi:3-keto-disaccharide hydrolase